MYLTINYGTGVTNKSVYVYKNFWEGHFVQYRMSPKDLGRQYKKKGFI